ncbi:MAG: efflux RND transporter periplasmic adaptor subunit [Omnitrophica bacterium]|nr:efflux RND transporter periplasmic adaptor subunit [Candidatus Omnitrophota bacterium]
MNLNKLKKPIAYSLQLIAIVALLIPLVSCGKKDISPESHISQEEDVAYYTCGMHPSVKVSPEEYDKGSVSCPICNMALVPVYKEGEAAEEEAYYGCGMEGSEHVFQIKVAKKDMKCPICGMPLKKLSDEEADKLKGVASKVKIKGKEAALAGVATEKARKWHLYKKIRTVGKIAYDPELAIAEDEFVSALRTLEKAEGGSIPEISERARSLVKSSERKLKLLGLGAGQIDELRDTREVHTGLILPDDKMWVYGNVYEYELNWVKVGGKVEVMASSFPGEALPGVISSVNPVLDPKTRSVTFRVEIENPGLKLKPEMYVDLVIQSMYAGPGGERMVLAIPKDAVLDTGVRKIVWVDKENGEYEGRIVEVGPLADTIVDGVEKSFYPILRGIAEGERVVTRANFLIDSQSQISGVVAASYGGALGAEEKKAQPAHQH